MKITHKREIILVRERRITINLNDEAAEIFCRHCKTTAHFITANEAAAINQTTAREIFRMVEDGRIHFRETAQGSLLVCLESLTNLRDEHGKLLNKSFE